MKFQVLFKTPDAVHYGIQRELEYTPESEDEEEQSRLEVAMKVAAEPFTDGENITIEFDTEAGTATVVPRRR